MGQLHSYPFRMNTTVGFSVSVWVYPTNIADPGTGYRVIMESDIDVDNQWTLRFDATGTLYFFLRKAGSSIKMGLIP